MVMMPMVGYLRSRFEPRWLVIFGLAGLSFGLFLMAGFNLEIDFRHAVTARIVQRFGFAFLFGSRQRRGVFLLCQAEHQLRHRLDQPGAEYGGSTGIALCTTFIARREQFHQQRLIEHLSPLDGGYQSTPEAARQMFLAKGADAVHAAQQAQQVLYGMAERQASMQAFLDVFRLPACAFLAMIPLMFLMKKIRPGKECSPGSLNQGAAI